jgi:hypothetical protein
MKTASDLYQGYVHKNSDMYRNNINWSCFFLIFPHVRFCICRHHVTMFICHRGQIHSQNQIFRFSNMSLASLNYLLETKCRQSNTERGKLCVCVCACGRTRMSFINHNIFRFEESKDRSLKRLQLRLL